MQKLSDQEYKQLVIDVAIAISPKIIQLKNSTSDVVGATVALYARDIAEAVDAVLRDNTGNSLK